VIHGPLYFNDTVVMQMQQYDVIAIGSDGLAVAEKAAQFGK